MSEKPRDGGPQNPHAAVERTARAFAPSYDEALQEPVPPSLARMANRLEGEDDLSAPPPRVPLRARLGRAWRALVAGFR